MTQAELRSLLGDIERDRIKAIREAEETATRRRGDALQSWADEHAQYKLGDILEAEYPDATPYCRLVRIRIKSIHGVRLGPTFAVSYVGQRLLPDLTESNGVETIYQTDKSNQKFVNAYEAETRFTKLDKPRYTHYIVKSNSRTQTSKSYHDVLDICHNILTGIKEDVYIFGVAEDGTETKLMFYPCLAKYFDKR